MNCERCENYDESRRKDVNYSYSLPPVQQGLLFIPYHHTYAILCTKCMNEWVEYIERNSIDFYKREQKNITNRYALSLISHNTTLLYESCKEKEQIRLDLAKEIRPTFLAWLHTKPNHANKTR